MDVYIYQQNTRKIKGEEVTVLAEIGVLEQFESIEDALEALVDEAPDFMGVELVVFTEEPQYITVEEPPPTKYAFSRRNGNTIAAEEEGYEEEPEAEEEQVEEAPVAVATKRRPAKKPPARSKPAAKQVAKKRPASRAGTRAGSGGRRSPFTRNAASAE